MSGFVAKEPLPKTAEAVIIGGGVNGCSLAYHLAKKGLRDIVLLEKDYLASGGTGRSAAGIRHQFGTEINIRLSSASIKLLEGLKEETGYSGDLEINQGGYLMVAYTESQENQLKKNIALQNSLGIASRYITPQEIHEIVPALNLAGVRGASFYERDGHANPFHVTLAYAEAAARLGVKIFTYTEVTGIKLYDPARGMVVDRSLPNKESTPDSANTAHSRPGKASAAPVLEAATAGNLPTSPWSAPAFDHPLTVHEVVTPRGSIFTPRVVNVAGAHGLLIGRMVGLELPIVAERHQILVTEPVAPLIKPMIISFDYGTYCKQEPHGGIVMGIGDPQELKGFSVRSSWQFLQEVSTRITNLLPVLKGVRLLRQWAGLYDITPDAQPILGEVPEIKGFYNIVGFSGHGFMLGPIIGKLMADLILGEEPALPIHRILDLGRFARGELIREPAVV